MATKIVRLHHNINLKSGVMSKPGVAWGNNALQTITIARHTPFNPQQAVGYKGIVDYTSSPVTSDLTLDCILTENSVAASPETSVYNHADLEVIVGQESYVLTSCNINFQAGNPATVNYGYITAGLAEALLATANPAVLKDGEEAAFAVVMGEDGQGVRLVGIDKANKTFSLPAGIQTLGFTASMNRNQILDVRSSSPIQFVTTYPLDLSMNLEMLQSLGYKDADGNKIGTGTGTAVDRQALAKQLNDLTVYCGASKATDGLLTSPTGNRNPAKSGTPTVLDIQLVKASGLMLTEEGESVNVGGNLTFTYNYTAADIEIPLEYEGGSNSGSGSAPDPDGGSNSGE